MGVSNVIATVGTRLAGRSVLSGGARSMHVAYIGFVRLSFGTLSNSSSTQVSVGRKWSLAVVTLY